MSQQVENKFSYYVGVLFGAYLVIGSFALGIHVHWWTPIIWAVIWACVELIFWMIRNRKRERT